jgi:hypothetical protein
MKMIFLKNPINLLIVACLSMMLLLGPVAHTSVVWAQESVSAEQAELDLLASDQRMSTSDPFVPVLLKGIKIYADNPLRMDFIIDTGDAEMTEDALNRETSKLITYFLAALTIPEADLWVNLSPTEPERIIPPSLGRTEMGRDLLQQDYLLKQLTASLTHPETELGQQYWEEIYAPQAEVLEKPEKDVQSSGKVWIVPRKAVVYENGDVAFVVESELEVLHELNYLQMQEQQDATADIPLSRSDQALKDVLIPVLEHEVNTGRHFAPLRQICSSMILAGWFKKNLMQTLIGLKYAEQEKINGIDSVDQEEKDRIYNDYVQLFQQGLYDIVVESYVPEEQAVIPRRYYSGGFRYNRPQTADLSVSEARTIAPRGEIRLVENIFDVPLDDAMLPSLNVMQQYLSGEKELALKEIWFGRDGNAEDNFREFMQETFESLPAVDLPQPADFPQKATVDTGQVQDYGLRYSDGPAQVLAETLDLGQQEAVESYGRTIVVKTADGWLHIKLMKQGETLDDMAYDYDVMEYLRGKQDEWQLEGLYPEGAVRTGRAAVADLPAAVLNKIETEDGLVLDKTDGAVSFLAYTVQSDAAYNPFRTYLNDPDLSTEEFLEGLRVNMRDRMTLLEKGIFDEEILELYHAQDDYIVRPFDWMTDVAADPEKQRMGVGKISNYTKATRFPNPRLSGLSDFGGFTTFGRLIASEKETPLKVRVNRLLTGLPGDLGQKAHYIRATVLGDLLFSFTLLTATYLERSDQLNFENEISQSNTPLEQSLGVMLTEFFNLTQPYREDSGVAQSMNPLFLAQRMRAQVAYYFTNRYFRDLNKNIFWAKDIVLPPEVYGPDTVINTNMDRYGWDTVNGFDLEKQIYRIPSRNPDRQITRNSADTGYLGGFFGAQEIFRMLYAVTTLRESDMTLAGYDIMSFVRSPQDVNAGTLDNASLTSENVGGIDLTGQADQVQVEGPGMNTVRLTDPAQWQDIQIFGLQPGIINIHPVRDVPGLLGVQ